MMDEKPVRFPQSKDMTITRMTGNIPMMRCPRCDK